MDSWRHFIRSTTLCLLLAHLCSISAQTCVDSTAVAFTSSDRLLVNGERMALKGVSWFGFEGTNFVVQGLDQRNLGDILDILQNYSFNAIRIPFTADLILNLDSRYPSTIDYSLNPSLQGLTSIEVLDEIFTEAGARGITIMPDMHLFDPSQSTLQPPLWYSSACTYDSSEPGDAGEGLCTAVEPTCITNIDGTCVTYTEQTFMDMWTTVVSRYSTYWNFLGVDLQNEPHEPAVWGDYGGLTSDPSSPPTDWAAAAERVADDILTRNPSFRGLIFVEGIGNVRIDPWCENATLPDETDGHWWGDNFEAARCRPLSISDQSRLVYSPHSYGPSVYDQAYFSAANYPDNMPPIWDGHFGSVRELTGKAVVIGEWGGPMTGSTLVWLDAFSTYLIENDFTDNFHWALNPNPGSDTPGIMTDWFTPDTQKLEMLATVQPTPTLFTAGADNTVCFTSSSSSSSSPLSSPQPSSLSSTLSSTSSSSTSGYTTSAAPKPTTSTTSSSTTSSLHTTSDPTPYDASDEEAELSAGSTVYPHILLTLALCVVAWLASARNASYRFV